MNITTIIIINTDRIIIIKVILLLINLYNSYYLFILKYSFLNLTNFFGNYFLMSSEIISENISLKIFLVYD